MNLNARRMILVLAVLAGLASAAAINARTWEQSADRMIELAQR